MAKRKPITTELQLKRMRSESKAVDVKIAHTSGLVVRFDPAGGKSFRWDRGSGNKPRVITYGQFPDLSLAKAISIHNKTKERHKDGTLTALEAGAPTTVKELAEVFYTDRIVPNRKRPEVVRAILNNDIIPQLGSVKLRTISTLAVRKAVLKVTERGATTHAGKVLAIIKQMLRFGVAIGVMEFNAADTLERVDLGIQDNQRDRVLDHDELKLFWHALESAPRLSLPVKVALQLLTLLGLRSAELRQSRWEEIDDHTLTIPVKNQKLSPRQEKKGKPFVVPLTDFALGLFDQLRGLDEEWIFPGSNEGPIADKVFCRATSRLFKLKIGSVPLLPMEKFTPHDLRRTMRSNLSQLGVPPHVAERCLNHSLGRILATYDQYDYLVFERKRLNPKKNNNLYTVQWTKDYNAC
ncbi:MAG: tyrosine-type recombinase/integrase, partial [gamma proteobacterium symbiont of Bathyaustriella thionipta]|nr:tyrosine-type recombinase/integrase [gamma proteobacterium symbiont of Bathyaustriella thionipta]